MGSAGLPKSHLETNDMFKALTHERRRYLLYTLFEDDVWSLEDLARKLAAWENDVPEDAIDQAEIDGVYASLYHAHVPKLVEFGILEFDRRDERISRGPGAKPTLDVLEHTGGSGAEGMERHARGNTDDE